MLVEGRALVVVRRGPSSGGSRRGAAAGVFSTARSLSHDQFLIVPPVGKTPVSAGMRSLLAGDGGRDFDLQRIF